VAFQSADSQGAAYCVEGRLEMGRAAKWWRCHQKNSLSAHISSCSQLAGDDGGPFLVR